MSGGKFKADRRGIARQMLSCVAAGAIAIATVTAGAGTAFAQESATRRFEIASQPLADALLQISRQGQVDVTAPERLTRGRTAPAVSGAMSAGEALDRVLAGSGLSYRRTGNGGFIVAAPASGEAEAGGAAADDGSADGQTIVVTGTHIQGAAPIGAPILVFGRDEFERAGVATSQEFLATLTQNFGGTHADNTTNFLPGLTADISYASEVNLRGLGPGTTLTLVDGRRLARGGAAEVFDVSLIPLAAIERVEVLTDGASAIYGSEAVGGVVNFITRRGYSGSQSRVRFGTTTRGDGEDYQLSHTIGRNWGTGSFLGSYTYNKRESASSLNRLFSRGDGLPRDLVPDQQVNSIYLSSRQQVTPAAEVNLALLYSDRRTRFTGYDTFFLALDNSIARTRGLGLSLGADFSLSDTWRLSTVAAYGRNQSRRLLLVEGVELGRDTYVSQLYAADLQLSGALLDLPAGPLRVAMGTTYREETYDAAQVSSGIFYNDRFDSSALFGELSIPVIGSRDSLTFAPRLGLSLAARYEHYSNFGGTFDPKVGVEFVPTRGMVLRGSFGTSFRAPTAVQRTPFNGTYQIRNLADPQSPTGTTRTLILLGNNPELGPESARTWTAGVDLQPPRLRGFRASLTFFDISYDERVLTPPVSTVAILPNPDFAPLVTRRSDLVDAEFNQLITSRLMQGIRTTGCPASFFGADGVCREPASNFGALIDRRIKNLAGTHTSGFDLSLSQSVRSGRDSWSFSMGLTYLFDYEVQTFATIPGIDVVDTAYNPLDLKLRASAGWSRGALSVNGTVNHAGSYLNNLAAPAVGVESWTTVDVNAQYDFLVGSRQLRAVLTVRNLFDQPPPPFRDPTQDANNLGNISYDPANSDPLGRAVSLSLVFDW